MRSLVLHQINKMIPERTFTLINQFVRDNVKRAIDNLPVNASMEVVIRERKKQRTKYHNAAMWAGMLNDIEEQAWLLGRQYHKDIWHEHFKREFLPEGHEDDFAKMVLKGYEKWRELPSGERICIGSTTKLTKYGMALYMQKCEAYAANDLGVRFTVRRDNEYQS